MSPSRTRSWSSRSNSTHGGNRSSSARKTASFETIGRTPLEVASTLGAGPIDRFFSVAVPLARRGFLTAATLGFAHTLGEFGVVLMIGGNIPGETRVASIAIYDHVESLDYVQAHWMAAALLVLSFLLLLAVYGLNRRLRVIGP